MQKGNFVHEGKGKRVYEVAGEPGLLWLEFKDQLTAFNALKKGQFVGKGELNCRIATRIFQHLKEQGVESHFVNMIEPQVMITRRLQMVPLEVVVRNILAGSTAKKFGIEEGTPLKKPLVEFYYKNDALQDPFISDEQALFLETVNSQNELDELKRLALKVNDVLIRFFDRADIDLVDFKLEFGRAEDGRFLLGDEISPDSCRLWDQKTKEKLDKDRFRRDLGQVQEKYEEVWKRIQ